MAEDKARRDAEKADRRRAILTAAEELLTEVGYEAFSMVLLAKKTGIAKGGWRKETADIISLTGR